MKKALDRRNCFGDVAQDFVNRIAHRSGQTLAIMSEASVTLQQVILLSRIKESRTGAVSDLASALGMSLPSMSQMIDRLHRLGFLTRTEDCIDRRKKQIALTKDGLSLLDRLYKARSTEFEAGAAKLSPQLRSDLGRLLRQAVDELDERLGAERITNPLARKHRSAPPAIASKKAVES